MYNKHKDKLLNLNFNLRNIFVKQQKINKTIENIKACFDDTI